MTSSKGLYDAKVLEAATKKTAWDTAKAAELIGKAVKDTQDLVVGADVNADGKKKDNKTAADALAAYAKSEDTGFDTAETNFKTAATTCADGWKEVADLESGEKYDNGQDWDCAETANDAGDYVVADVSVNDKTKCIAACNALLHWKVADSTLPKEDAYCYGIELMSDDKCRLYKVTISAKPDAAGKDSAGSKNCSPRDSSTKVKKHFVTDKLQDDMTNKATAYTGVTVTNWETKIDAAEVARRDLALETAIQTYITDTYYTTDAASLVKVSEGKESEYNTAFNAIAGLKATADGKGMDDNDTD